MALIIKYDIFLPASALLKAWMSVLLLILCNVEAVCAEMMCADTLSLDNVNVTATDSRVPHPTVRGTIGINSRMLDAMPHMFGENDMLRLLEALPGVSSGGDYASGFVMDGASIGQHAYRLNNVQVLFPYHFGGILSTVNGYLYPSGSVQKSAHSFNSPLVCGAVVDLWSSPVRDFGMQVNAGMLASSVGARMPLGRHWGLEAGYRVSFISKLYHGLLRGKSTDLAHDFNDLDLHASYEPSSEDKVDATLHYNGDFLDYDDANYDMETGMKWHNLDAGISWRHMCDEVGFYADISYSQCGNRLSLDMSDIGVRIPVKSRLTSAQFRVDGFQAGSLDVTCGIGFNAMFDTPQAAYVRGLGSGLSPDVSVNSSYLADLWGEGRLRLSSKINLRGGVAAMAFYSRNGYAHYDLMPRVTVSAHTGMFDFSAHVGRYVQPVHYVGLSEIGLASNFRYSATAQAPVQTNWHFTASGRWRLSGDMLSVGLEGYCRIARNEAEYVGSLLEMLDTDYDVDHCVKPAAGRSYGMTASVSFDTGEVSGWGSYTYGVGRSRFYDSGQWFVSSGDVKHSFKVNMNWAINGHWSVGAMFSLSSGRPVTPVQSIYVIGEKLMMEYGKRNSSRLPLYHRLDFGGSYTWKSGGRYKLRHTVGIGIINAYGHRNIEMQSWAFSMDSRKYYLRNISSLYRFLPSLSYTLTIGE